MITNLRFNFILVVIFVTFILLFYWKNSVNNNLLLNQKKIHGSIDTFRNGIPKIVHYTYKDNNVPSLYQSLLDSCLQQNPDVHFVFWSDEAALRLVTEVFPDKLDIYRTYLDEDEPEKLKKTDVIRPLILYRYGGIYMDMDTHCMKPMHLYMDSHPNISCFLTSDINIKINIMYNIDQLAMNSMMACVPKHRFFSYLLDRTSKNTFRSIVYTTGPFYVTKCYNDYLLSLSSLPPNKPHGPLVRIEIANWTYFSPYFREIDLEHICFIPPEEGSFREKGCKLLSWYEQRKRLFIDNAILVHEFYHLGYTRLQKFVRGTFDINRYAQNLVIITQQYPVSLHQWLSN